MAVVKAVSFKDKKDKELIDFIEGRDFSYYIKDLIRKDMNKEENINIPSVQKSVVKKRNINFDM